MKGPFGADAQVPKSNNDNATLVGRARQEAADGA